MVGLLGDGRLEIYVIVILYTISTKSKEVEINTGTKNMPTKSTK